MSSQGLVSEPKRKAGFMRAGGKVVVPAACVPYQGGDWLVGSCGTQGGSTPGAGRSWAEVPSQEVSADPMRALEKRWWLLGVKGLGLSTSCQPGTGRGPPGEGLEERPKVEAASGGGCVQGALPAPGGRRPHPRAAPVGVTAAATDCPSSWGHQCCLSCGCCRRLGLRPSVSLWWRVLVSRWLRPASQKGLWGSLVTASSHSRP